VQARVQAMLGANVPFELEWVSVYTFQCRRLEKFRHGRVLFAGDSAHQVSPFGARGANSGVQDADNLAWKLDMVLAGDAPEVLLDSYEAERVPAADENIRRSTQATDFITPKNAAARLFRTAALELARDHEFARRLVNSGRLSVPTRYADSPLSSPDDPTFASGPAPGAPAFDAALDGGGFLLGALGGDFCALSFGADIDLGAAVRTVRIDAGDQLAWARYDARPGTVYLFRPDQHVCYRARRFDRDAVLRARARALGKEMRAWPN